MNCKLCEQRWKTWNGSDPKCAFTLKQFSIDNWNCSTMNNLRDLVEEKAVYSEDQYCALLPVFNCGEFLLLSWYKSRGKTEGAWIVDSSDITPLTLNEAEVILDQYSGAGKFYDYERPFGNSQKEAIQQ